MKFHNPKTGEVFEVERKGVASGFCAHITCGDCLLPRDAKTWDCTDWVIAHPAEAARLMGYEVVKDEEEPIERTDKPRICEVLGGKDSPLEVGEVFTIRDYPNQVDRYAVIHTDGKVHNYLAEPCQTTGTRIGNKIGSNALYWLINHPDRIIRQPRFTREEVAVLRTLCAAGAHYLARGDKHLRWYAKRPYQRAEDGKWDMQGDWGTMSGKLPAKLFPSIRPGQTVRLEDVPIEGEHHG